MVVIVSDTLEPKIRGVLGRWFIEPRPNVFVGCPNVKVLDGLLSFIKKNSTNQLSMIILSSSSTIQKYKIATIGSPTYQPVEISGYVLIARSMQDK